MVDRRLRELAERYGLDRDAVELFERLLTRLASDPQAPTTVRDPERAVDVHVADSLSALQFDEVRRASVLADLGSGAGFPALVLAIAQPHAQVLAVESAGRKCAYLQDVVTALGLRNVDVVRRRAEEWTEGLDACDVVCARALAPLAVLCEYAAPLLRRDGVLVAWKGELSPEEIASAKTAARRLALSEPEVVPVQPFAGSQNRHLARVNKTGPTPPGFPRRAGMAVKRPLG